jgi:hypothetical protein
MGAVQPRRGFGCASALRKATALLLAVTGCSTATPPAADAGDPDAGSPPVDAAHADAAPPGPDAAPPEPYRHTLVIDGVSSFTDDEAFTTTTAGYTAFVTWDDEHLYLGYQGGDLTADDPGKWLLAYVDVDPAAAAGAASGERYNTQSPSFPAGFRPDYYYRWQSNEGVEDVRRWSGSAWQPSPLEPVSGRVATTIEVALPLAELGATSALGVVLFWLNETDQIESTYGGLYQDSFPDGYHALIPISRYLEIDLASPAAPNDLANRRP